MVSERRERGETLLKEVWEVIVALWNTGNNLARIALLIIIGWPLLMVGISLIGISYLTPLVALILVMGAILLGIATLDPLVVSALALFRQGQQTIRLVATVVSYELIIGIYFSIVPVAVHISLVPLLLLSALTFFFLLIGKKGLFSRMAMGLLGCFVIFLTYGFFAIKQHEVEEHTGIISELKKQQSSLNGTRDDYWGKIQALQVQIEEHWQARHRLRQIGFPP